MTVHDPFMAFGWYFTDVSRRDASRYLALEAKPAETSVLMNLIEANSLVHYALWNELPKNHPVAELWLESETDLQATIYLAYGGFFRQALTILRAWFEIAVHGVFFSAHYGQSNGRYELWRRGQRNAPANMNKLAEALASRQNMIVKVDEATILRKLRPVYSFLSQQTHAQGLDIHDLQKGRDNVPRFLSRSYDIWFGKTLEAFDALSFLYKIFFPKEIASYLKKSEAEMHRAFELKESLSKVMPDFADLMTYIFSLANESK